MSIDTGIVSDLQDRHHWEIEHRLVDKTEGERQKKSRRPSAPSAGGLGVHAQTRSAREAGRRPGCATVIKLK
jgi:hypothetical protein